MGQIGIILQDPNPDSTFLHRNLIFFCNCTGILKSGPIHYTTVFIRKALKCFKNVLQWWSYSVLLNVLSVVLFNILSIINLA